MRELDAAAAAAAAAAATAAVVAGEGLAALVADEWRSDSEVTPRISGEPRPEDWCEVGGCDDWCCPDWADCCWLCGAAALCDMFGSMLEDAEDEDRVCRLCRSFSSRLHLARRLLNQTCTISYSYKHYMKRQHHELATQGTLARSPLGHHRSLRAQLTDNGRDRLRWTR